MTDWNQRYNEGFHSNAPLPLVVEFAAGQPPGRALDVASGAGRHAIWLAGKGWQVTAVDSSPAAMDILQARARESGVHIRALTADLEHQEFTIEADSYDLIVVTQYLQRDLFPKIRRGTRPGGIVIAVIATIDDDPNVKPMNPAFLLSPGELRAEFETADWQLIHYFEGKPSADPQRRKMAEMVARRLR